MPKKLLIANRGEIACRIMQTAHNMGVKTVAVYSDADATAQHRLLADEAVRIGPAPVAESYLKGDVIIQAALETGADAIHPGYGFLSENPDFVEAVEKAGLTFVGPSAKAIRAMGLKDAAKKLMEEAEVPVVPGYHGDNQDAEFLASEAEKIGYPVLIKARAGGGGKGMRKVDDPKDFAEMLEGAVREGEASFGDGRVLIEKYITAPRHIEIQVFGDNHGNVVHLFERDCSLQRRHQKVIEEAPAPGMTEEMRAAMGEAAVKAAKAINYSGAGTIEFIVDGSDGLRPDGFWFMEMNTRLQVEHPVTEAITGVDLVEWQLRVADDEYLPKFQDELQITGHAFEARLYAEDVPKGFLPATGTLEYLEFSDRARNDSGVVEGDTITPFYDPMIAKVITHGETRNEALSELEAALGETRIAGTVTNAAFLHALCNHSGFGNGEVDTGLIERDYETLTKPVELSDEVIALAAKHALDMPFQPNAAGKELEYAGTDPFEALFGFSIWEAPVWTQKLTLNEEQFETRIRRHGDIWQCKVKRGDGDYGSSFTDLECLEPDVSPEVFLFGNRVAVFAKEGTFEFTIPDPLTGSDDSAGGGDTVIAPMPGLVKKVSAKTGDAVEDGDALIVLEAMKMEHTLVAPRDGIIAEFNVNEGDQVEDGDILIALEASDG
ncbi:MAG: acetyl/propionyl/methylcrotonyl-CoA carboxylase subunit alpha [Rhizobiaceae bacterium]|nr:acetyl/propionyl/methylcrotonyl-CoA carboxylase subunit alpha [Rhizobiaceae bacterium]